MVDFHHFIYKFFINYRHDGIGEWRVRRWQGQGTPAFLLFKLFIINCLRKSPSAAAGQGWPALPKTSRPLGQHVVLSLPRYSGRDAVAPLRRFSKVVTRSRPYLNKMGALRRPSLPSASQQFTMPAVPPRDLRSRLLLQ